MSGTKIISSWLVPVLTWPLDGVNTRLVATGLDHCLGVYIITACMPWLSTSDN